jgi:hypothetical protein
MLLFNNNKGEHQNTTSSNSDPTALNQDELATILRIAEGHSLSHSDQVKLVRLAQRLKKQAYEKSQKN